MKQQQGDTLSLREKLAQMEIALIMRALSDSSHIVSHAAAALGVKRTTLVEKMKRYGIAREDSH